MPRQPQPHPAWQPCHRSAIVLAALSPLFYFANFCLFCHLLDLLGWARPRLHFNFSCFARNLWYAHIQHILIGFTQEQTRTTTIGIGNKMWTRMKNVQIMCAICVESGLCHLWLDYSFLWPFKKLLIFGVKFILFCGCQLSTHSHTHTLVENCYVSVGQQCKKPKMTEGKS